MARAAAAAVRLRAKRYHPYKDGCRASPGIRSISLNVVLRGGRRLICSRLLRLRRRLWLRCGLRRRRWCGCGSRRRSRCRRCLSDLDLLQLPAVQIGCDLTFAPVIRCAPGGLGGIGWGGRGSFGRILLRNGFARLGLSCCLGRCFLAGIRLSGRRGLRLRSGFGGIGLRSRFGLRRCFVRLSLRDCNAQATERQRSG